MLPFPGFRRAVPLWLRSLLFVAVVPGTVVVLVPWLLAGGMERSLPSPFALRALGGLLVLGGAALWVPCLVQFAARGRGTPSPLDPPERLVVAGPYRHVRNPMYLGGVAVLVGEALWLGSVPLLFWAGICLVVWHVFVRLHEEPALARRFGDDYDAYRRAVPRWIPRLAPWRG